jgi:hypothetical protein
VLKAILGELSEPKVGYFGLGVVHEDVGNFEVPVDDILLREVLQSFEDVLDDGGRLVLVEVPFLAQTGLEVSLVAELGDDVAVAVAGEDLEAAQDVGMA